jgi:hypothetical protein
MADLGTLPGCCGINELKYVANDKDPVRSLMDIDVLDLGAHVVFSVTSADTERHAVGHAIAKLIESNGLGPVVSTKPARNPEHSGTLKAWLWTPNKTKLRSWQAETRKANPGKYERRRVYNPYGWW